MYSGVPQKAIMVQLAASDIRDRGLLTHCWSFPSPTCSIYIVL